MKNIALSLQILKKKNHQKFRFNEKLEIKHS